MRERLSAPKENFGSNPGIPETEARANSPVFAGIFARSAKETERPHCLADDAVRIEPVSDSTRAKQGKIQGKTPKTPAKATGKPRSFDMMSVSVLFPCEKEQG
ncbi:hypothetical protein [Pseudorhodoplanes sp.]|uniref:hypothetical protein n=1 Tax=Pseudorhodoplanes sp. TaxID=1934341 RepID=UPI003D10B838